MEKTLLEKAAYQGVLPRENLSVADKYYFYALRALYSDFAHGKIKEADAKREKERLYADARISKERDERILALFHHQQEGIRLSETFRSAALKNATDLRELSRLLLECVYAFTGDSAFRDAVLEKFDL